jgi:hypothetical protein
MSEQATETGPLTVDAAIAALTPQPVEQDAPEAPVEAAEEPNEPEGEASSPEEAEAAPEEPAEGEETEADSAPVVALDPPRYWSQDAKAEFAKLPADLQAVVLAQEGPREEAAAKAKAEAAEIAKAAQADVGKVQQLAQELAEFLPQAIDTFQNRWGAKEPDWIAFAQEHGTDATVQAKLQFEAEQRQLQQLAVAAQKAEAQAHEAFVKREFEKLAEIAPDLADPEKGPERRSEITQFLVKQGVDPAAIGGISAVEMALARDAMKWRQAQAQLQAAPKPKPAAPAPRAPARPAASAPAANPQRTAANRFAQTRSVDDAVALLLAKKA